MTFNVTWETGTQDFATEEEAIAAAGSMKGIVLVHEAPTGSVTTFRDGRELDGAEATEAFLEFQRRRDVGDSKPE